jgi:Tfp pilus assembly protein PilF
MFSALSLATVFITLACSHQNVVVPSAESEPAASLAPSYREFSQEAWVERAKDAYRQGNFIRATRLLETAFVFDPTGPDLSANHLLFYLYLSQSEYARALLLAKSLVKKHPYQALSYYHVGLAELWSADPTNAMQNFRRALEFADAPARTHFYLGLAYGRLGNQTSEAKSFQAAERELRQILKKNPKDFAANFELAHLYLYWNVQWQKSEALVAAARANLRRDLETALAPQVYRSHYLALIEGMYLTHKGQPKEAIAALWESLQNAPDGAKADTAEIYYYLGVNFLAMKANTQARNFLKKAVLLDPTGPYSTKTEPILRSLASDNPRRNIKSYRTH